MAFFAERGIPAVNFGPGDSELAHTLGLNEGRLRVIAPHEKENPHD